MSLQQNCCSMMNLELQGRTNFCHKKCFVTKHWYHDDRHVIRVTESTLWWISCGSSQSWWMGCPVGQLQLVTKFYHHKKSILWQKKVWHLFYTFLSLMSKLPIHYNEICDKKYYCQKQRKRTNPINCPNHDNEFLMKPYGKSINRKLRCNNFPLYCSFVSIHKECSYIFPSTHNPCPNEIFLHPYTSIKEMVKRWHVKTLHRRTK